MVKTVGKGSFGTADLVQDRRDKNMYILKKTRLARQPELQREASIQEMFIQKGITHRNIVRCKESWIDKAFVVCLVLEYCSLGELSHALQNRKQTDYFPEDAILEMFVQLVSSLDYLHKSSIVHRDIKAGNVFVRQDCSLALGDFGLSQVEGTSPELSHTMLGTPQYMAPEIVSGTPMYTCKTDVWALGESRNGIRFASLHYTGVAAPPRQKWFSVSGCLRLQGFCSTRLQPSRHRSLPSTWRCSLTCPALLIWWPGKGSPSRFTAGIRKQGRPWLHPQLVSLP